MTLDLLVDGVRSAGIMVSLHIEYEKSSYIIDNLENILNYSSRDVKLHKAACRMREYIRINPDKYKLISGQICLKSIIYLDELKSKLDKFIRKSPGLIDIIKEEFYEDMGF